MRQTSLKPDWKRKFVHTTDSKHDLPIVANVLACQFDPTAPNKAYVTVFAVMRNVFDRETRLPSPLGSVGGIPDDRFNASVRASWSL